MSKLQSDWDGVLLEWFRTRVRPSIILRRSELPRCPTNFPFTLPLSWDAAPSTP